MRTFAYCCASFLEATRKAAGVEPRLSPPTSMASFDLAWLEGRDLLYFDLHGQPGAEYWLGDHGIIALTAKQVRSVDLGGAVVFAVNCHLADEDSPMLDALLDAGARYVIGGDGRNWAGTRGVYGASEVGMWMRRMMVVGYNPLRALALAKRIVRAKMPVDEYLGHKGRVFAADDALGFRAYERKGRV